MLFAASIVLVAADIDGVLSSTDDMELAWMAGEVEQPAARLKVTIDGS